MRLVLDARPHIFNHNLETVERLTPFVRSRAKYRLSLEVLRMAGHIAPDIATKSGIMLGLGETENELFEALDDLRSANVQVLTMGQYLRPTPQHLPVREGTSIPKLSPSTAKSRAVRDSTLLPAARSSAARTTRRILIPSVTRSIPPLALVYRCSWQTAPRPRPRGRCRIPGAVAVFFHCGHRARQGVQSAARRQPIAQSQRGCFRLVLDERRKKFSSRAFAEELRRIEGNPRKTCALLVGGADGLSEHVRESADLLWSLSPLTLQHEMALVVALEQIYRAHTILAGIPYHRD